MVSDLVSEGKTSVILKTHSMAEAEVSKAGTDMVGKLSNNCLILLFFACSIISLGPMPTDR